MSTTLKYLEQGTEITLMSTELNSLANDTNVLSSVGGSSGVFNNINGGTGNMDGYVRGTIEANIAYTGTATANTAIYGWFIRTVDGTNYEYTAATPVRNPDFVIVLGAIASAQRRIAADVNIPVGQWKLNIKQTSGLTWASSGNTIKAKLSTDQGV